MYNKGNHYKNWSILITNFLNKSKPWHIAHEGSLNKCFFGSNSEKGSNSMLYQHIARLQYQLSAKIKETI